MWPFSKPKPPDNRPPSAAALAIARSLREESTRWRLCGDYDQLLAHDSGIMVNSECGSIESPESPWFTTEPAANKAVLREAIDVWIEQRLLVPAPNHEPQE